MILLHAGESRVVRMHRDKDGLAVAVDGAVHRPRVAQTGPNAFVIEDGARREEFHCVRDGDVIHLSWRGVVYTLEVQKEARRAAEHFGGSLDAPMPGRVIKINVAVGQSVKRGDEILVLEAMKMENSLRAPADGAIKALHVVVGAMADAGQRLAEIE